MNKAHVTQHWVGGLPVIYPTGDVDFDNEQDVLNKTSSAHIHHVRLSSRITDSERIILENMLLSIRAYDVMWANLRQEVR